MKPGGCVGGILVFFATLVLNHMQKLPSSQIKFIASCCITFHLGKGVFSHPLHSSWSLISLISHTDQLNQWNIWIIASWYARYYALDGNGEEKKFQELSKTHLPLSSNKTKQTFMTKIADVKTLQCIEMESSKSQMPLNTFQRGWSVCLLPLPTSWQFIRWCHMVENLESHCYTLMWRFI